MKTTPLAAIAASLFSLATGRQFVQYTPGGDDPLVERADPILSPGAISQHVHQVFGANTFAPDADYDLLNSATCTNVGGSDGYGNSQDKSNYWIPSLYMESANNTGYVRVPTNTHKIYYRDFGSTNDILADPFEFPKGFRMLAGNALMRAPNSNSDWVNIHQWICHTDGAASAWPTGAEGAFPQDVTDCPAYPGLNAAIDFPHCWNGQDFNQATPTAHMSYADGDPVHGDCPSTHPTRLPHIFMENEYDLHSIVDQVKPNSFVLAQGDPTGYGFHADFFNGWDTGAIPDLLQNCYQGYYGNEDISNCTGHKMFSTKASDCTLKKTFDENVDTPGQNLPGCNPKTTVNPAPALAVAALGLAISDCAAGNSSSGSSSSAAGYGSSSSAAAAAAATTTMTAASASSHGSSSVATSILYSSAASVSSPSEAPTYSSSSMASSAPEAPAYASSSSSAPSPLMYGSITLTYSTPSPSSVSIAPSQYDTSSPSSVSIAASPTTLSTLTEKVTASAYASSIGTDSTSSSGGWGGWGNNGGSGNGGTGEPVVWVTEYVTVTARDAEPSPVAQPLKFHGPHGRRHHGGHAF